MDLFSLKIPFLTEVKYGITSVGRETSVVKLEANRKKQEIGLVFERQTTRLEKSVDWAILGTVFLAIIWIGYSRLNRVVPTIDEGNIAQLLRIEGPEKECLQLMIRISEKADFWNGHREVLRHLPSSEPELIGFKKALRGWHLAQIGRTGLPLEQRQAALLRFLSDWQKAKPELEEVVAITHFLDAALPGWRSSETPFQRWNLIGTDAWYRRHGHPEPQTLSKLLHLEQHQEYFQLFPGFRDSLHEGMANAEQAQDQANGEESTIASHADQPW